MKFGCKFTFLFLILVSLGARANDVVCPWQNSKELLLDKSKDKDVFLNSMAIQEDLACLKVLLETHYVANEYYKNNLLIQNLDGLASQYQEVSNRNLIKQIFNSHNQMYDLHLGYNLLGTDLHFESLSNKTVKLKNELQSDKVIQRKNFIYFKPGDLFGELTEGQQSFIDLIKTNDKNTIIDLRQNEGGDDIFAFQLAEQLFTQEQKIPRAKRLQITSSLTNLGLCNLINLIGYRGYEDFCINVDEDTSRLSFSELLKSEIEETTEELIGKRLSPFKSKIILIIDSGCASSCETIVEKLSAHPNVKLIGQNTMGALHFSNPISFQLPHSGILVRIPTLFHQYENDAPEGKGYSPDEYIDSIDLDKIEF